MSETIDQGAVDNHNAERVGVILVHGIGEQRRFQHLDGQLRDIIVALQSLVTHEQVSKVTVDIRPSESAAFHAEQDSWRTGPEASVTVVVEHTLCGEKRQTHLKFHEVWWADVNERYSLRKQIDFWLWGLQVWSERRRSFSSLATASESVSPPLLAQRWWWDRPRLFLVGVFFVIVGFSVGAPAVLAARLLDLQIPQLLRTLTNYLSSVKLLLQEHRWGTGFLVRGQEDFLESVEEPPRVTIRRRMIRAIADVACQPYSRWYILAHSQGTVIAFNGLMEPAYAWPGYLNHDRWDALLKNRLAGPAGKKWPQPYGFTMPRRPAWAGDKDVAYRSRIFSRFRGFLTYGSPLQKFAGLWPALVPIGREAVFQDGVEWINLYDPIDPVSGRLTAFQEQPPQCCPRPRDCGYAASWGLLVAHLKYLTRRKTTPDAATATVSWLLTNSTAGFSSGSTGWKLGTWFTPNSPQHAVRSLIAWSTWLAAAVILAMLSAIVLPSFVTVIVESWEAVTQAGGGFVPSSEDFPGWLQSAANGIGTAISTIARLIFDPVAQAVSFARSWIGVITASAYWQRVLLLLVGAMLLTLIVGSVAAFARALAAVGVLKDPQDFRFLGRKKRKPIPANSPDFVIPSPTPDDYL
jgi:hypothetical protein